MPETCEDLAVDLAVAQANLAVQEAYVTAYDALIEANTILRNTAQGLVDSLTSTVEDIEETMIEQNCNPKGVRRTAKRAVKRGRPKGSGYDRKKKAAAVKRVAVKKNSRDV